MTYREIADSFEVAKRDNGNTFVKLKDSNKLPDGFMCAVHEAVDGDDPRLPDDWIYQKTIEIADSLAERATYDNIAYDVDGIVVTEIADNHVDIYSTDLLEWAKHGANTALIDEACEDTQLDSGDGVSSCMLSAIQQGQFLALERIASYLIDFVEGEAS